MPPQTPAFMPKDFLCLLQPCSQLTRLHRKSTSQSVSLTWLGFLENVGFPEQALMAELPWHRSGKAPAEQQGMAQAPVTLSMGCSAGDKEQAWSRKLSRWVPAPWLSSRHPFPQFSVFPLSHFPSAPASHCCTSVCLFANKTRYNVAKKTN